MIDGSEPGRLIPVGHGYVRVRDICSVLTIQNLYDAGIERQRMGSDGEAWLSANDADKLTAWIETTLKGGRLRRERIGEQLELIVTHMRFVIEALPEDKQEEVVRKMLNHVISPTERGGDA